MNLTTKEKEFIFKSILKEYSRLKQEIQFYKQESASAARKEIEMCLSIFDKLKENQ